MWGRPVSFSVLRRLPGSLPLPRSTTPLAATDSGRGQLYTPGASSTAPRKPLTSGNADTSSMAAWIAVTSSSPPDGFTVRFTGTVGRATPPPM